jgi:hypothetical protein
MGNTLMDALGLIALMFSLLTFFGLVGLGVFVAFIYFKLRSAEDEIKQLDSNLVEMMETLGFRGPHGEGAANMIPQQPMRRRIP